MQCNYHWGLAGITFIGTDTITTKIALDTGMAIEANPLANLVMDTHGYIGLVLVKMVFLLIAYLVWYYDVGEGGKWGDKMRWLLPRYCSFIGVGITLSNILQITIIYLM